MSSNGQEGIRSGTSAYMETQLETETMKAVPTPRFDLGENVFAAQLLQAGDSQKYSV